MTLHWVYMPFPKYSDTSAILDAWWAMPYPPTCTYCVLQQQCSLVVKMHVHNTYTNECISTHIHTHSTQKYAHIFVTLYAIHIGFTHLLKWHSTLPDNFCIGVISPHWCVVTGTLPDYSSQVMLLRDKCSQRHIDLQAYHWELKGSCCSSK